MPEKPKILEPKEFEIEVGWGKDIMCQIDYGLPVDVKKSIKDMLAGNTNWFTTAADFYAKALFNTDKDLALAQGLDALTIAIIPSISVNGGCDQFEDVRIEAVDFEGDPAVTPFLSIEVHPTYLDTDKEVCKDKANDKLVCFRKFRVVHLKWTLKFEFAGVSKTVPGGVYRLKIVTPCCCPDKKDGGHDGGNDRDKGSKDRSPKPGKTNAGQGKGSRR
jgi:hypothetical protein